MVEEFKGWKTGYGSLHATEEDARKAEREEALSAFSEDLRVGLGISPCAWDNDYGDDWAKNIFENAQLINHLLDKYKLV